MLGKYVNNLAREALNLSITNYDHYQVCDPQKIILYRSPFWICILLIMHTFYGNILKETFSTLNWMLPSKCSHLAFLRYMHEEKYHSILIHGLDTLQGRHNYWAMQHVFNDSIPFRWLLLKNSLTDSRKWNVKYNCWHVQCNNCKGTTFR